jgi:hypothetical protein
MTDPTTDSAHVPHVALRAFKGKRDAELKVLNAAGNPWEMPQGQLNSTIRLEPLETIETMLEAASFDTPEFLRGVLLSQRQYAEIKDALADIRSDVERARRIEHSYNANSDALTAGMAGFLSGLLAEPESRS